MHNPEVGAIIHQEAEYRDLRSLLTKKEDVHFLDFIKVMSFITRHWSGNFNSSELQVLIFIIGRTLGYKKRAETIAFRHFIDGLVVDGEVICCPCGLSENTIRRALKQLNEKKVIRIHAFFRGKVESLWRIYEVNVENLLGISVMNAVKIKPRRAILPLPAEGTPPSPELVPKRSTLERMEDTNVSSSAALLPTPRAGRRAPVAVDCKSLSPEELVASISGRASATRATRVKASTTTPKNKWKTNELQDLLDQARDNAVADGYRTPRMVVVAKNIGVLHRRLLEREITDPLDFFTWVLKNWETIASANRRSSARQAKDRKTAQTEMAISPTFNDLSFKAPYFITFYNDREQVEINKAKVINDAAQKTQQVAEATQKALQTRKAAAQVLDRQRDAQRKTEELQLVQRVRRQPKVDLPDDGEIPVFKERVWGSK